MIDFNSILRDARQLPEAERVRLIGELCETVPDGFPLDAAWEAELERRVASVKSGQAKTTPWETIRAEAIARINDNAAH